MASPIISIAVLAIFFISGCNPTKAHGGPTAERLEDASRKPSWVERNAALASDYSSPRSAKKECFGRLLFDVQQPVEWSTFFLSEAAVFSGAFSERVFDHGDEMRSGNTKVRVLGPADGVSSARFYGDNPVGLIEMLKASIVEARATLAKIRQGNETAKDDEHGVEIGERIQKWENSVKKMESKYKPFELGLPESFAYASTKVEASNDTDKYSVFRAYLIRGAYTYVFETQSSLTAPGDFEKHRASFKKLVSSFRPRAANEIPTELGVCIPFGFLPDDGKTKIEFKQSLRFPDAPGVLYTIHTGDVRSDRLKMTPIMAAARAGLGLFGTNEEAEMKPFVTKRIGPRPYKMGGLTGQQGGVALHVKQPNREPFESYTVFTGYSGWLGTAVLPYILVDMNSFTKKQAPELTQNPPPFDQSMSRLELLLKSMRLRPTNPPMPELRPESK